jgi:tetratricopeptide (TPR) repeat protein
MDKNSRDNLALAYYDLGQYQYAVDQYDKIITLWPQDPKAYLKLSKVYLKLKKYSRAMDNARKGYTMDPKAGDDIIALGDMLKDEGVYDKAREFYELTLNSASHKDDGYLKLGVIAMAQGDKRQAVELLNQGLKANPENKDIREKLKELGAGQAP